MAALPSDIPSLIYLIAKTFGFPALMVLALGAYLYKSEENHRSDMLQIIAAERVAHDASQKAFLEALDHNTAAVEKMAGAQETTNDKLDDIRLELRRHDGR